MQIPANQKPALIIGLIALTILVGIVDTGTAFANGGTILVPEETPFGGVMLVQQEQIRLVSEVLNIDLLEDLDTYRVSAEYTLASSGAATAVVFGVPLLVVDPEEPSNLPDTIEILLDGVRHSCSMVETAFEDPRFELPQKGTGAEEHIESDWLAYETGNIRMGSVEVEVWCVTEMTIPAESEVSLHLAYTGQLDFADQVSPSYGFPEYSERILYYPFYPAATWEGKVEDLSITVGLGPYREQVLSVTPTPTTATESSLMWSIRNVDLALLEGLVLVLDPLPDRHFADLCEYNGRIAGDIQHWNVVPLRAVSPFGTGPLRSVHYRTSEPRFIADGDPHTAWCTDDDENYGRGQWVDLRLGSEVWLDYVLGGDLYDIAFINGLTYSEYEVEHTHGRVTTLGMALCGSPDQRVDIPVSAGPQGEPTEAQTISPNEIIREFERQLREKYEDPDAPTPCLRLTVVDSEPGDSSRRTCISEFALVCESY